MEKVSVFIPVYKESNFLKGLLERLTKDPYKKKEIIVVIDEPTSESLKLVKRYGKKVKFILNKERKGKANALNEAVKYANGKIFLFLDSDVQISLPRKNFFKKIVEEMRDCDLLEIKKGVKINSFISRLVQYDYAILNFINLVHSKLLKKGFQINGAAFAINKNAFYDLGKFRKAILEDLELGTALLLKNKRFKYTENVKVLTEAPSSWSKWFAQRKRWSIGFALWLKTHYTKLGKYFYKYPSLTLPYIFLSIPFLFSFFSNLISFPMFDKLILLPMSFFKADFTAWIVWLFLVSLTIAVLKNITFSIISFVLFSLIVYVITRKVGLKFNLAEFFVYSFFYCPILALIALGSLVRVFVYSQRKVQGWKV
jgi:cellulose synthase/poly-beta-1,6-N-acetylglucosamine synthase-like glycosyltransferase